MAEGHITPLERLSFLGDSDSSPIIRGLSHLLSGYPKSGKTELLSRLVSEWSEQGLKVLYLTEEPRTIWEARLGTFAGGFDNVELIFAIGAGRSTIQQLIENGDEDVVVVDTLRLLMLADENDNSIINRELTPLIAVCRAGGQTIVIGHHNRKGGGDHGEAAAGGHAFLGIVDVGLELERYGQAANRRRIKGQGRIFQVPELVYELQGDSTMKLLGDPQHLGLQQVKERAISCLTTDWQPTMEIRKAISEPRPSDDQLTNALTELAVEGSVERDPPISDGPKPGKTYLWRLST